MTDKKRNKAMLKKDESKIKELLAEIGGLSYIDFDNREQVCLDGFFTIEDLHCIINVFEYLKTTTNKGGET